MTQNERPIALIGAMQEEIEALQQQMQAVQHHHVAGLDIHAGTLCGRPVVAVMCGIGKVNMALCAQLLIDRFDVCALINPGCAGGLGGTAVGDLVLSTQAVERDFDCTACGDAPGVIPRMACSVFPADPHLLGLAEAIARRLYPQLGVHTGPIATGDQFLADPVRCHWLHETFGALAAEMECAAMAHVAHLNGLPWLSLRAISDNADTGAAASYLARKDEVLACNVRLVCELIAAM